MSTSNKGPPPTPQKTRSSANTSHFASAADVTITPLPLPGDSFSPSEQATSPPNRGDIMAGAAATRLDDERANARASDRLLASDQHSQYAHVVGIINPGSGVKAAAQYVTRSITQELGQDRVCLLNGEVFAHPEGLRRLIRDKAVVFELAGAVGADAADAAAADSNANTTAPLRPSHPVPAAARQGTVVVSGGDGTVSFVMQQVQLVGEELRASGKTAEDFILPAIGTLPLGTGNDFANSTGFGGGYNKHTVMSRLTCQSAVSVVPLLQQCIRAPAVPFDRWHAQFIPLSIVRRWLEEGGMGRREGESPHGNPREEGTNRTDHGSGSPVQPGAAEGGTGFCGVDWGTVAARYPERCPSYDFINYLSVGYDAYVTCKFDGFRRRHPLICSDRVNNKLVYGLYGIKAGFRVRPLPPLIPSLCVPSARASSTAASVSQRPVDRLRLPSGTKALVLTNVNCYSAGAHPWKASRGKVHYHPQEQKQGGASGRGAAKNGGKDGDTPPVITPVAINDRRLEVQGMAGTFHYAVMRPGLVPAKKIAQVDELCIFVLCTPDDVHRAPFGEGGAGPGDGRSRASLSVQVDGEAVPRVGEPTVVYVRQKDGQRVDVRCQNPKVTRHETVDSKAFTR